MALITRLDIRDEILKQIERTDKRRKLRMQILNALLFVSILAFLSYFVFIAVSSAETVVLFTENGSHTYEKATITNLKNNMISFTVGKSKCVYSGNYMVLYAKR